MSFPAGSKVEWEMPYTTLAGTVVGRSFSDPSSYVIESAAGTMFKVHENEPTLKLVKKVFDVQVVVRAAHTVRVEAKTKEEAKQKAQTWAEGRVNEVTPKTSVEDSWTDWVDEVKK